MTDPLTQLTTPDTSVPAVPTGPAAVRRITNNVSLTDLNDASVKQYEFDLYGGKKDYIDRLYLASITDIVKGRVHYHDKLKGGVLCQSVYELNPQGTQEHLVEERFCCKHLGSSTVRFAVLVVKYNTDKSGNAVQPFGFEQKLWKFGADKFNQLRNINKDWPLTAHDISVSCTDEQYQKMQIGAKPDCYFAHPKFPADTKQLVLAWVKASLAKLPRELGRTYDEPGLLQVMREAGVLTTAGPAPTMTGPGDAPVANFADVLGGLGGGTSMVLPGTVVPTPGQ